MFAVPVELSFLRIDGLGGMDELSSEDLADAIERLRGTGLGGGMHRNICLCQENPNLPNSL